MAVGWRRWRGEWAAYGPADALKGGATVTVTRRSGPTSQVQLAEVHPAAAVDGVSMAYGLPGRPVITEAQAAAKNAAGPCEIDDRCRGGCDTEQQHLQHRAGQPREQRHCMVSPFCGDHCDDAAAHASSKEPAPAASRQPRSMCEGCGTRRAVTTATDHNGISGRVCSACAAEIRNGDSTIH